MSEESKVVIVESTALPPPEGVTPEPVDDEAPWGRKADGTPRKRPGRRAGSGGGSSRLTNEQMQAEIADKLGEVLIPLSFVSPLAGAVIDDRVDKTAHGLMVLAGNSPRFKRWLDRGVKAEAVWEIVSLPIAIGLAIQVDREQVDPNLGICRRFNIDKHYAELYRNRPAVPVEGEPVPETPSGFFGSQVA